MNQNYDPTRQQQGNPWDMPPAGMPQPYSSGGLAPGAMNYALWVDRVVAALIDGALAFGAMVVLYIIIFVVFGAIFFGGAAVGGDAGGVLSSLGCCGGFILIGVLPPVSYLLVGLLNKVFWVSSRGYSIGQGVMKLKVVDASGNLISNSTAFMRLLCQVGLGFVPVFGGLLDLLFPLFDEPTRQTLHDKAVGTYVIKT